jgi:hypothetical protein
MIVIATPPVQKLAPCCKLASATARGPRHLALAVGRDQEATYAQRRG